MAPRPIPHLTLISFSGAHATGKSTLLDDLARSLEQVDHVPVACTESCSQALFQGIRAGAIRLPEGIPTPEVYDDLNRLGLRDLFQRALPDALSGEIESAFMRLPVDPLPARAVLLVDRWFTDILAYTVVESDDGNLHRDVLQLCRARWNATAAWLLDRVTTLRILNVFVPVSASVFSIGETTKFRATGDRGLWERACLNLWDDLPPGRSAMLRLTTSDRRRRVQQIRKHLRAAQPDPTT